MIRSKESPGRNLYKFIFVLPFLISTCFAVNPVQSEGLNKKVPGAIHQLNDFEGYYHADKDPNLYLQIMVKNNKLVLKQLWDDREITFEQKSALDICEGGVNICSR